MKLCKLVVLFPVRDLEPHPSAIFGLMISLQYMSHCVCKNCTGGGSDCPSPNSTSTQASRVMRPNWPVLKRCRKCVAALAWSNTPPGNREFITMNNGGFEFVVILKNDACKLEKLAFHRQSCYTTGHTLNIIALYTYLYCKQWKAWLDLGMELHQILIALFQAPCPASMSELYRTSHASLIFQASHHPVFDHFQF